MSLFSSYFLLTRRRVRFSFGLFGGGANDSLGAFGGAWPRAPPLGSAYDWWKGTQMIASDKICL